MVVTDVSALHFMFIIFGSLLNLNIVQVQSQSQMSCPGSIGGGGSSCCPGASSCCPCDPCSLDLPEVPIDPFEGISTEGSTLVTLVNLQWPLRDVSWYFRGSEILIRRITGPRARKETLQKEGKTREPRSAGGIDLECARRLCPDSEAELSNKFDSRCALINCLAKANPSTFTNFSGTDGFTRGDLKKIADFVSENDGGVVVALAQSNTTEQQRVAFEAGQVELSRIEDEEEEILKNNITLDDDEPTSKHQISFGRTDPISLQISKGAIISETATASFRQQLNLSVESVSMLPILPLISECEIVSPFNRPSRESCVDGPYRTLDGSCNNLAMDILWGAAFTPYRRDLPADYDDDISSIRRSVTGDSLPSARLVSTSINNVPNEESPSFSILHMTFGQFLDHDLTSTPTIKGPGGSPIMCCGSTSPHFGCLPISIPSDDPFYGCYDQRCMEFVRSTPFFHICNFGAREQGNQHSAYLDGSVIYGVQEHESEASRTFNCGLLKTQVTLYGQTLLPPNMNLNNGCNRQEQHLQGKYCFDAGDGRVNEQILLTFFHTIFAREHNRIATELKKCHDDWDDEKLFQEARRIVWAQLQQITYNEFLPTVIGPTLMVSSKLNPLKGKAQTTDYNQYIDASIANNFAAAAYRFGHSLVHDNLLFVTKHGKTSPKELSTLFFNPFHLYQRHGLYEVARGGLTLPAFKMDAYFSKEVAGKLFKPSNRPYGLDLLALNIQRGRDHGLPPYTQWLSFCGLQPVSDFDDLLAYMDEDEVEALQNVYESVHDIDLYAGGVSERPLPGALVGHTFTCLLHNQFFRMKYGDRYWFEYKDSPGAFTPEQMEQLHEVTLARIMCNNLPELEYTQRWPLRNPGPDNPMVCCKSIREYSLKPWTSNCPC